MDNCIIVESYFKFNIVIFSNNVSCIDLSQDINIILSYKHKNNWEMGQYTLYCNVNLSLFLGGVECGIFFSSRYSNSSGKNIHGTQRNIYLILYNATVTDPGETVCTGLIILFIK